MPEATLVLIHGFWSSAATWDRLTAVWAADDTVRAADGNVPVPRIHPFGYRSPKRPRMPFSRSRIPDHDDIAQTFATEYTVKLADAAPIVIVTHSQGGLVLQRFLAWMVQQGRGRELSRIASVVMIACPNNGTDYLRSLRHALGYRRHPQAGGLEVLDRRVADTQRTVLQRIVNADRIDDHQCRIPFHVYAGADDRIVPAASAQAAFPGASTLAGDHHSILDPGAPGNSTADAVRHHILGDVPAWLASNAEPERQPPGDDIRENGSPDTGSPETASPETASPQSSSAGRSGSYIIEGPFSQSGNIIINGEYVAGHDMNIGNEEDDKSQRRA